MKLTKNERFYEIMMILVGALFTSVLSLRRFDAANGITLQIAGDQISRIQLIVRIDQDGSIFRHQSSRSSSFEIGRIGGEMQVFVQNVSKHFS